MDNSPLSPEGWRCSICQDLLFKPAVNCCGHVFCFWCFHRAMSPWMPSACPMCRAKYSHLPAICPLLHSFLATQFPDEYAERRRETEEQEADEQASSPEPLPPSEPPPSAHPPAWQPRHFRCDHPACGQLLCQPVVLNCGHIVCSACRPGGSDSTACPACGALQPVEPSVCRALDSLLVHLFPAEQAARAADQAAACVEPAPAAVSVAEPEEVGERGAGNSDGGESQPSTPRAAHHPQQQQASGVPEASSPPASGPSDQQRQQQQQQQQQLSPSLQRAIGRGRAGGGRGGSAAAAVERSLLEITEENYTHHGVGCDACGLYPIVGRRYQCKDCEHVMGFDLCQSCHERDSAGAEGRFAQGHTAQHRMELVRPRVTAMHLLQAANPDLTPDQLFWLLELALAPEQQPAEQGQQEEGEVQRQSEGGGVGDGGGSQEQQESESPGQQQQAGVEEPDRPIPPPRGRGPRPAPDPSAQWPSPSAP